MQPPKSSLPLSAFETLQQLGATMMATASGLPISDRVRSDWAGVIFLSGKQMMLTPLVEVIEILPVHVLVSIPGTKPWLLGMATSRGEIFAVTDFRAFLSQPLSTLTLESRILVHRYKEEYSGFLVDRVLGLLRQSKSKIVKPENGTFAEYEDFVLGTIIYEHVVTPIISLERIIQHPRFRDVTLREDELSLKEFEG